MTGIVAAGAAGLPWFLGSWSAIVVCSFATSCWTKCYQYAIVCCARVGGCPVKRRLSWLLSGDPELEGMGWEDMGSAGQQDGLGYSTQPFLGGICR